MTPLWFFIAIFLGVLQTRSCFEIFNDTSESNNFHKVKDNIKASVTSVVDSLFPAAYKIITESNVSMSCTLSLVQFFRDIKKLKEWALKMFDANGKLPAGFLEGNIIQFGDYDECLDVVATNERRKPIFVGKYCMVKLGMSEVDIQQLLELNITDSLTVLKKYVKSATEQWDIAFRLGLCVPSVCTAQEINQILHTVTKPYGLLTNVACETKKKIEPTTVQLAILWTFAIFGFLVIVGTTIDLINQYTNFKTISGKFGKLLIAFSFYSNTIRLFKTAENENTIRGICGCRVLTSFWIILFHIYFWPETLHFSKYRNLMEIYNFTQNITFETAFNGALSIETFFLISGYLSLYTMWRKLEFKGLVNPAEYLLSRIARMLPDEMLVIALFMILPLFGNGPIWNETLKAPYNTCENNWWTNVLFIQNFWSRKQICLLHTWFIPVLFQLHIFAFGLILVLYRWPKIGIFLNVVLVLIGCFIVGFLTSSYNLPASYSNFKDITSGWMDFDQFIYHKPYTYASSYCIGILLGYVTVTKQDPKLKQWVQIVCWLVVTCVVLTSLYGVHFLDADAKREFRTVYAALHRTVFSLSISWILFCCVTGKAGIAGKILSWKGMIALDRLSYLIYLLHPLVIYYHTASTRTVINMSHIQQIYIFLATVVITLWFSYLFNVTIEQPINRFLSFTLRVLFSKMPHLAYICQIILIPSRYNLASLHSKEIKPKEVIATKFNPLNN